MVPADKDRSIPRLIGFSPELAVARLEPVYKAIAESVVGYAVVGLVTWGLGRHGFSLVPI